MDDLTMAFGYCLLAQHLPKEKKEESIFEQLYGKLLFPNLLKEFMDYTPQERPPYGKDWNYELDRAKEEAHRKIDDKWQHERWMSIFKETGNFVFHKPKSESLYVIGVDPYA